MQYLLHASLLIGLLYGFYRLLLSRETFFGFHRWILLGGVALAFVLPLISIPSQYSLKDKLISQVPTERIAVSTESLTQTSSIAQADAFANVSTASQSESFAATSTSSDHLMEATRTSPETVQIEQTSLLTRFKELSSGQILMSIYLLGTTCLIAFLLFQLLMLARFRRRGEVTKQGRFTIVEHNDCDQSFSFGRVIYLHKSADQILDRDHIIRHEMIHARQLHTIDIIIGEMLTIVLWFNPFAWMYKKAMRDNLEYLTDRQMLDEGADTKAYQLSLVRITVPHTLSQIRQPSAAVALANNYNHSTLKQRIIMMNKKYSNYAKVWRHFMVLPILVGTMILGNNVIAEQSTAATPEVQIINQKEEKPQKAENPQKTNKGAKPVKTSKPNKEEIHVATVTPIIEESSHMIANVVAQTISDVVPSVLNNMDISAITDAALQNLPEYDIEGPINGRWEKEDGCIHFWIRGKNHFSNWTECDYDLSAFSMTEGTNHAIKRDAGVMNLIASGDDKEGKFTFTSNDDFMQFLEDEGIGTMKDREMMHLFNTDINRDYIKMLDDIGFRIDRSELVALAIHGVDDDELNYNMNALTSRGFDTKDIGDLITMSIHNVDAEYMDEIDDLGFKHRRLEDYVSMRIHNVDKDLVESLSQAGYEDLTADEIVSMAIHNVDGGYINDLSEMGYKNLPIDKIVSMAIHNVDTDFLREVEEMGFDDLDLDEIVGFAIHNVDEDYIRDLKDAGITDLNANEITSFAIHDVDPELIELLHNSGFKNINNDDIISAAIHGIDKRFLKDLNAAGMSDLDFDDIISFAIHDVDSDYIQELRSLGIQGLTPQDMINGSIHGVDADFAEEIKELGFDDLDMDDLIELRIHDIDARDIKRLQEKEGEKKDLKEYSRRIRRQKW